jgi:hypothetical protein
MRLDVSEIFDLAGQDCGNGLEFPYDFTEIDSEQLLVCPNANDHIYVLMAKTDDPLLDQGFEYRTFA